MWLGSLSLAPDERYSLDPSKPPKTRSSRKSRHAIVGTMKAALDNVPGKNGWDEAALRTEFDFTVNRKEDLSKLLINESPLMSTHRWFASTLPVYVISAVVEIVLIYHAAMKEYTPLLEMDGMPNAEYLFDDLAATEETRPDIVALFNALFTVPEHVDCFIYSVPDDEFMVAWKCFEPQFAGLSASSTAEEILAVVQNTGKVWMVDPATCFWCEKSGWSGKLQKCNSCSKVMYCGKDCQTNDWKAFHKKECKILAGGKPLEQ